MAKEKTTEKNILKKLRNIEGILDIIEEDIEDKEKITLFDSNVTYIMPYVIHKWSLIEKDDTMTLFELIDLCEDWANELAISVLYNKNKLNNKTLTNHLHEVVNVCRFIMFATHNYLHGLNKD